MYKVAITDIAEKELKKLFKKNRLEYTNIINYLKKLNGIDNPRKHGKKLKGPLKDYWRYRVGKYRIICEINDSELIILTLDVNHRRNIYSKHTR